MYGQQPHHMMHRMGEAPPPGYLAASYLPHGSPVGHEAALYAPRGAPPPGARGMPPSEAEMIERYGAGGPAGSVYGPPPPRHGPPPPPGARGPPPPPGSMIGGPQGHDPYLDYRGRPGPPPLDDGRRPPAANSGAGGEMWGPPPGHAHGYRGPPPPGVMGGAPPPPQMGPPPPPQMGPPPPPSADGRYGGSPTSLPPPVPPGGAQPGYLRPSQQGPPPPQQQQQHAHHAHGGPLPPHHPHAGPHHMGGPPHGMQPSAGKAISGPNGSAPPGAQASGSKSASRSKPRSGGSSKDSAAKKEARAAAAAAANAAAVGGGVPGRADMAGTPVRRPSEQKRSSVSGSARKDSVARASGIPHQAPGAMGAGPSNAMASESKKDKKRREVIDRIHRVHWDTIENREVLYQELHMALSNSYATLLASPSHFRTYNLAMARLTLQRDADLRQSALMHAYKLDSARQQHETERAKAEDEARIAKKNVREKLLAIVEERRKRLKEEKEGGELAMDVVMEQAQRPHATRKLRNKAVAGARASARGLLGDDALTDSGVGGGSSSVTGDVGGSGGAQGGPGGANGGTSSVAPFFPGSGANGAGNGGGLGGSGGGYYGIGTATNGLGSLLQNMGFSSADVLALTAAGRLGLHFGAPALEKKAAAAKRRRAAKQEKEKEAEQQQPAEASSSSKAGQKRKSSDDEPANDRAERTLPVDVMEAITAEEVARGSESGVFAGLNSGVDGLHLVPASFLDALGLGGPGSGFGAGGLSGLLEGTGAHAPSIIVGPGGANSSKNKKKKGGAAAAAAAAAAATSGGAAGDDAHGGLGGALGLNGHLGLAHDAAGGAGSEHTPGGMSNGGGSAAGNGPGGAAGASGANGGTATAANMVVASIAAGPGGRLRWDVGKSLLSLTSAKTIEIEGDLINLRKIGSKRRRR